MRKLLLLALLLYDIVTSAARTNLYDYDDLGLDAGKLRHPTLDEKRHEWRRKNNLKELEHKEWEERNRRHDYENRYFEDLEKNFGPEKGQERGIGQDRGMGLDRGMGQERRMGQEGGMGVDRIMGLDRLAQERATGPDRPRERDNEANNYRRRYEDVDKLNTALGGMKSTETGHPQQYLEKEPDKKAPLAMSCDRPHERYESCFSGCAAVSCDNPRDRLRLCYPFCESGCVCVSPYVRDDRTHKCVLPDDCTKGLKGIPDLGEES